MLFVVEALLCGGLALRYGVEAGRFALLWRQGALFAVEAGRAFCCGGRVPFFLAVDAWRVAHFRSGGCFLL